MSIPTTSTTPRYVAALDADPDLEVYGPETARVAIGTDGGVQAPITMAAKPTAKRVKDS